MFNIPERLAHAVSSIRGSCTPKDSFKSWNLEHIFFQKQGYIWRFDTEAGMRGLAYLIKHSKSGLAHLPHLTPATSSFSTVWQQFW